MPTFNSDNDEELIEETKEEAAVEETPVSKPAPVVVPEPVVDNSAAERLRRRHLGYI